MRRIKTNKLYVDIAITPERFICRNNEGGIKIIKFNNLKKDLKSEIFGEDYYKNITDNHNKSKDKDTS